MLDQEISEEVVEFTQLAPNVWMHTSYKNVEPWGLVFSNGLVIERGEISVLVDSAWNDEQTEQIIDWAKATLHKPIKASIHTHAHSDKMGGMTALHDAGIDTTASSLSNELAAKHGLVPANNSLEIPAVGDQTQWYGLTVMYPGGGHTLDNIVVFDNNNIIFGGCLIRPSNVESLGNTSDADLTYWSQAVQNVADAFPDGTLVIPSHGEPAGREILANTIRIATP